jgi:hypothetical protein
MFPTAAAWQKKKPARAGCCCYPLMMMDAWAGGFNMLDATDAMRSYRKTHQLDGKRNPASGKAADSRVNASNGTQ